MFEKGRAAVQNADIFFEEITSTTGPFPQARSVSLLRKKLFSIAALVILYSASFGVLALGAAPIPADKCTNLKSAFAMAHGTISSAEIMPAGSTTNLQNPTLNGLETKTPPVTGLPAFCRVIATLTPTSDSNIGIEVWLPQAGWNGKLQSTANHEAGGIYYYGDMSAALKRNYAVASTDTGHTFTPDSSWAVGHPEKIVDYSWRAVHEMTLAAKAIIAAYYGSGPRYSYYNGCSTGGRQTLKEAQMFPNDYDGILSGSGFHYWTHQIIATVWKQQVLLKDGVNGASYLPPAKHDLVVNAAMNDCKSLKQVPSDSFLGNPTRCGWDPKTLVCKAGQDTNTCITAAQADALEKIYEPLRNPRTNAEIYPGTTRVSEPNWADSAARQAASPSTPGQVPSLQALVSPKTHWDWRTMNFDSDVALADESDANGPQIDAINPDLMKFKQHGGKLIEYQGWLDPNLSTYAVEHYENVVGTNGEQGGENSDGGALTDTQSFYRLFLVPAMGHCRGGPGPNSFGAETHPDGPMDPQHNIFAALEQWVEHGIAPTQIIATKYVKDDPKLGVSMQRPICPYPQEARYKGIGSTTDAASFQCVNAPRNTKNASLGPQTPSKTTPQSSSPPRIIARSEE